MSNFHLVKITVYFMTALQNKIFSQVVLKPIFVIVIFKLDKPIIVYCMITAKHNNENYHYYYFTSQIMLMLFVRKAYLLIII